MSKLPPSPPNNSESNWNASLDDNLMRVSPADFVSFRHLAEGTLIFGATGSGKTSGPGDRLAELLLNNECGFLILCAKSDEKELWLRRIRAAKRERDLFIFGVGQKYRFNLLDYAYNQSGLRGGKDAQNCVNLLMSICEVKDRSAGAQGEQKFWHSMAQQLLSVAIILLGSAGEAISFESIDRVIRTAPHSFDELQEESWRAGFLNQLLDKVAARGDSLSDLERTDAAVAISYFLETYPALDDRTRAGIVATCESILWPFRTGPLADLCAGTTNLQPDDAFDGKIILLDLPLKQYHESGLLIQVCWKLLFQRACESRDLKLHPRPVVLFIDECQLFITSYDTAFLATARSARVCSVFLTQNIDGVRARFPGSTGQAEAECLLGQFGQKIFCANDHVATNRWSADLCGEEYQIRSSTSANLGSMSDSIGASTNEQKRHLVPPLTFARLKRGGPENGSVVETILFRSGRLFNATGTNFLKAIFRQG